MRLLLLLCLLLSSHQATNGLPPAARRCAPAAPATADGGKRLYTASISLPRGHVGGLLALQREGATVRGCLFNEFGITAIGFTHDRRKDKVKLHTVIKMMDRWYIRRVLRRDLREVLHRIEQGDSVYEDSRYHIHYKFTPLHTAVPPEAPVPPEKP